MWIPHQEIQGTIQNEHSQWSYTVNIPTGIIRRNRRDLNPIPSQVTPETEAINDSSTQEKSGIESNDCSEQSPSNLKTNQPSSFAIIMTPSVTPCKSSQ